MRFHGGGTAWNHVAMDQAILDGELEPADSLPNERTGLRSWGRAAHRHATIVEAANVTTKEKGPKRARAVRRAQVDVLDRLGDAFGTWFKIKGLAYSISSACASNEPLHRQRLRRLIQWGKQDVMFAGGCEELDWTLSVLFDAMGAMSSSYNDTPAKASRAYDKNRDGFVISAGAGVVVLEEYEHARARGAKIYAEIVGYGATSDGADMVAPSGEGAARCIRQALSTVNAKIDYINPHATSTPVGDLKEIEAIRAVFGSGDKCPPISATKSLTGHSQGATGVHEAIYTMLMMQNGFISESAHIEELDPAFADMPIVRKRIDNARIGAAISNSFGFGGTNATIVLKHVDA